MIFIYLTFKMTTKTICNDSVGVVIEELLRVDRL